MNTEALQAVGLALSTFVQEDAPTVGAALLASAGKLDWRVALIACFGGIWVGDAVLYLMARVFGRPLLNTRFGQRFIKPQSIARGEAWFAGRGIWALLLSRFVPGMRLPTYLAAGFLRVSFPRFLFVTCVAVLIWTAALFAAAHWLGDRVESTVQHSGLAAVIAGGLMLLGIIVWRRSARLAVWFARWAHWEFWPAWLFYFPVLVNYLWLAIRFRGLTIPTAANPGIYSGGIVGESKIATLRDLSATSPEFTAEARLIATESLDQLNDLNYPIILKPDVGQRGAGVKLICNARQAEEYIRSTNASLIIQCYAPGPHEAGVFYYRFPGEARGHIFAITEKIFPTVTGDGVHTIEELVWLDRRARFMARNYLRRIGDRRFEILRAGEFFKLVEAGNHAQGCIFRDGMHLWTEKLERRIDEISQKLNGFFIGRYDIRYASEKELGAGRGFKIIELNGAASEATSIYDVRNSLWNAYRTLFRQWELVFAIGEANRRSGSSLTSLVRLWRSWRETSALVATYPVAD